MHPMLNIAVRAARKAGNLIAKNYETPDAVEASQKGSNDFVTNVDKAAEAVIIDTIRKSYPQHTIITEESGELEGTDQDVQWVIDPLDGTTNFIKRLPHFAVSIAVRIKGRTEVAVVRSEEHTSELQSRFDLVCRLLLEKKKNENISALVRQSNINSKQFNRKGLRSQCRINNALRGRIFFKAQEFWRKHSQHQSCSHSGD